MITLRVTCDMQYLATRQRDVIRDIAQRSGVAEDRAEKKYSVHSFNGNNMRTVFTWKM